MKTKVHSRRVRDTVVEKFKAGLGPKTISRALHISHSSVQSIIKKWKEYGTTANPPRNERPPKQRIQSQGALLAEALKRPVVILEKLPRSTAQGRVMDGVGWGASRSEESFRTDTLSRLASFIARTDTKQHAHSHQPSHLPLYGCQECGKGFPYPKDLLQHQELKTALPKPHRCSRCGQHFSLRSSLQLHQCRPDSECNSCHGSARRGAPPPALLPPPGRLQTHLLDSSPYACAPCGRSFSQKQALLHHQQAGCSQSPSNAADARSLPDDSPAMSEGDSAHSDCSDTPGPSGGAVRMCRLCSRTFCTEAALLRHFQDKHGEEKLDAKAHSDDEEEERTAEVNREPNERLKSKKKLLSCRSCDMVFRSTSKLYLHRKEKHRREKLIRREPRPIIKKIRKAATYTCQTCSKVFFHHLSFKAHCRRHAAEDSAPISNGSSSAGCTVQDSNSITTGLSSRTVRSPPGRPRKLPKVSLQVVDPGGASERQEEPEGDGGDGEFPCPSCAEVFSVQQQLKEHLELHQSSVRRCHCSVCTSEMDASKGPASRRHRLYHCVPCQQGFSLLDSFLEHCQEHLRVRVDEERISEGHALRAATA